ncbi:MAG: hypothetical protein RSF79_09780, partial [Janthinobacterium sp.]
MMRSASIMFWSSMVKSNPELYASAARFRCRCGAIAVARGNKMTILLYLRQYFCLDRGWRAAYDAGDIVFPQEYIMLQSPRLALLPLLLAGCGALP